MRMSYMFERVARVRICVYMRVCVFVYACVSVCARACVRDCV